MTHDDLVSVAERWLMSQGCSFCFTGLVSLASEIPDAIGFKDYSILIECKASRSDFLSDGKKIFRRYPERGVGDVRFYMCEPGIINICDLPKKWGLLYVYGPRRVKKVMGLKSNVLTNDFAFEKNIYAEWVMMKSALRRIWNKSGFKDVYSDINGVLKEDRQ